MRWSKVAEVIGGTTIVASLIFVGIQIRQDHVIARSELGAASLESFAVINQIMIDPDFAAVWAKTLDAPKELSAVEMLRVNGFLNLVADHMARECYLMEREIFVECDNAIRDVIRRYFGNSYAQTWWRLTDTRPAVVLPKWVDAEISSLDVNAGQKRLEKIRAES
jgi:hypothetical protein